jgi:hypothetical protein
MKTKNSYNFYKPEQISLKFEKTDYKKATIVSIVLISLPGVLVFLIQPLFSMLICG